MKYLEIRSLILHSQNHIFTPKQNSSNSLSTVQHPVYVRMFCLSTLCVCSFSLPSFLFSSIRGSKQGPCVTLVSISAVSFPLKHIKKKLIHLELSRPVLTESYFLDLTDCSFMVSLTCFCPCFLQLWTEACTDMARQPAGPFPGGAAQCLLRLLVAGWPTVRYHWCCFLTW